MKKNTLTLLLLLVFGAQLLAQDNEALYRFDSIGNKSVKTIFLPFAFYTPETEFAFGAGAQFILLNKSNVYNSRLSNIMASVVYTTKKQLLIDLKPQIYLSKGDFFLDMSLKYEVFPNAFWGVGNTTQDSAKEGYESTTSEFRLAFLKRLPPDLNFGFEFLLRDHNVTAVTPDGILDSGEVIGGNGATISGLGVIFNLDTRDNIASPNSGRFLQFNTRFSSELLGGSTGYNKFNLDLRSYSKVGEKGVFATQIYTESTFGDSPFQDKAWLGGGARARGYFRGRFIDDHLYVLQVEYRHRFHPRWSAAAFGLISEVADLPENYFSDLKPSWGTGIRFKLSKDQDTLLRFDLGFGKKGNRGFYFGVNESF